MNVGRNNRFLTGKVPYHPNSVAAFNILLLAAGDVECNPGDVKIQNARNVKVTHGQKSPDIINILYSIHNLHITLNMA